jgi:hypothetical protein
MRPVLIKNLPTSIGAQDELMQSILASGWKLGRMSAAQSFDTQALIVSSAASNQD